ncbi:hypothetical protein EIP91_003779, partial [Steccherinum ochraceum]
CDLSPALLVVQRPLLVVVLGLGAPRSTSTATHPARCQPVPVLYVHHEPPVLDVVQL